MLPLGLRAALFREINSFFIEKANDARSTLGQLLNPGKYRSMTGTAGDGDGDDDDAVSSQFVSLDDMHTNLLPRLTRIFREWQAEYRTALAQKKKKRK